jgi:porphobilinogen synthase
MKLPIRPRRLRTNETMRRMVAEHSVSVDDLIEPLFVVPGLGVHKEIPSMPGVFHQSVDAVVEDAKAAAALGIPAVLLFGLPPSKDEAASWLDRADGPVQQAIEGIKRACPDLLVAADLCACEYTSHGHCGIVDAEGRVDNDRSVELLTRGALSYARSGVDFVAPSDMMDGRVGAIRATLDEAGFLDTAVMSYAVKYASAFYGPFRDAADSTPAFGDRRTHQMDPANVREAVKEALLDADEGADVIMVKPALAYLDVVRAVREAVQLPLAVYNVSGEYSMVKAAVAKGYLDEERTVDEMFVAFKRAGADIIVTYFARAYAARRNRR